MVNIKLFNYPRVYWSFFIFLVATFFVLVNFLLSQTGNWRCWKLGPQHRDGHENNRHSSGVRTQGAASIYLLISIIMCFYSTFVHKYKYIHECTPLSGVRLTFYWQIFVCCIRWCSSDAFHWWSFVFSSKTGKREHKMMLNNTFY